MHTDLEQFLQEYSDLVLINLWEKSCEASLQMDRLMQELERFKRLSVLRLNLTEYRGWASAHGIYGTPALIAYYRGRPLFRLIGRVTPAEFLQRLRDFGL